ncbi:hypothetical protein BCEN4_740018 [Burkholderia cenocepacia]|nr:hypothetical protein BCEN4_740018 [Burkholderia cenocepacia]
MRVNMALLLWQIKIVCQLLNHVQSEFFQFLSYIIKLIFNCFVAQSFNQDLSNILDSMIALGNG